MHSLSDLHGYQSAAVNYAMTRGRCALFLGLGLGKTIIALTVIAIETACGNRRKTLIIAPLRVANTVWRQEAANWEHTRWLRFAMATGSAEQRLEALRSDADVYVINQDNVDWLVRQFNRKHWYWDAVVVDESSAFKSPSSKRSTRLRLAVVNRWWTNPRTKIKQLMISRTKRIMLLSATPATNGLTGLWAQIAMIDGGNRLQRTYELFLNEYFHTKAGRKSQYQKPIPNYGAKEQIFHVVSDVVYVLNARDHLDMPELVSNIIPLDMPSKARDQYDELEREFLLEVENKGSIEEVIAPNEGALCNKLLQFCNGAVYTGETPERITHDRPTATVHDAKLDALQEIVEHAAGNENLLIAYYFQSDLRRILARFPHAQVMDKEGSQVGPWNRGEIPILLAQPLSAGMGLNLQAGGATCVFFSLLWQLEAYQQFIGRLYRQGQSRTVTVNHLVMADSIEQRVLEVLKSNADTQAEFLQALSRTLPSPMDNAA